MMGGRDFYLLPKSTPALGPTQSTIQGVPGSLMGEDLSGHEHTVWRLRMSAAVPLLHICAFMAWTGTTLQHCRTHNNCSICLSIYR